MQKLTIALKPCTRQKTNMSVDEDTELRDLVAQTLETNGVLGKIRVRLQSSDPKVILSQ